MKLITLSENTTGSTVCGNEHGLSIYIETNHHHILMDTGASDLFAKNAALLGVELTSVDTVILSHGHHDHGGGLMTALQLAPGAELYLQEKALLDYMGVRPDGCEYIGINKAVGTLPNCRKLNGDHRIDDELFLFTGITGRRFPCKGNELLKKKVGDTLVQDTFDHEQCLVLSAEGKHILLSGCAHNGIINILEHYFNLFGKWPDAVISGFHMMNISGAPLTEDEIENIRAVADVLASIETVYYTGHCTGTEAFDIMKPVLGDRLQAIHSGDEIVL